MYVIARGTDLTDAVAPDYSTMFRRILGRMEPDAAEGVEGEDEDSNSKTDNGNDEDLDKEELGSAARLMWISRH